MAEKRKTGAELKKAVVEALKKAIANGTVTGRQQRVQFIQNEFSRLGVPYNPEDAEDFYVFVSGDLPTIIPTATVTGVPQRDPLQDPLIESSVSPEVQGSAWGQPTKPFQEPYTREQLTAQQDEEQQRLRGILGATGRALGEFGPPDTLARRALGTTWGRFGALDPITRPDPARRLTERGTPGGQVPERGVRFEDFLRSSGRGEGPTAQSLTEDLQRILTSVIPMGGPPEAQAFERTQFRERFPTANDAILAGIQPYLTGVAPRQRRSTQQGLMDLLEPQISANPQDFASTAQIAAALQNVMREWNR